MTRQLNEQVRFQSLPLNNYKYLMIIVIMVIIIITIIIIITTTTTNNVLTQTNVLVYKITVLLQTVN